MRIQLSRADMTFLSPEPYNQIFTMHGATMIFWYASPILLFIFAPHSSQPSPCPSRCWCLSSRCIGWESPRTSCLCAASRWRLECSWMPLLSWSRTATATYRNGRQTMQPSIGTRASVDSHQRSQAGWPGTFLCSSSSFHSCLYFCSKLKKDAYSARRRGPRPWQSVLPPFWPLRWCRVLMVILIRGRLRPERANPLSRITQAIYLPILKFCFRHRWLTIAVNLILLRCHISACIASGQPIHAVSL